LFFSFSSSSSFAQKAEEVVCKEFVINGQKLIKWVIEDTVEEYDGNGKLIHIKYGYADYNEWHHIWYEYDGNGKLIREKDDGGGAYSFEYNNQGKITLKKMEILLKQGMNMMPEGTKSTRKGLMVLKFGMNMIIGED